MHDVEALVDHLHRTGKYRVLRHYQPYVPGHRGNPHDIRRGLILDVETTGLNQIKDRIIQISVLPFEFDRICGRVTRIYDNVVYFEDPGIPIPSEVVELTGITDEQVAGKRIDVDVINALASETHITIAHNARFDRRFVEQRLPVFSQTHWGCSIKDIDWRGRGIGSAALDYILYRHCLMFFDGHRADADCSATLRALATPFADGTTPLYHLLNSARRTTVRLWALEAAYEYKDTLKAHGYRWSGGEDGRPKAWYIDVSEEDEEVETAWLAETIYGGRQPWRRETYTSLRRYAEGF